jgi:twitching motility protein PilT
VTTPASIDELLDLLWSAGGTDLIVTAGAPPLLRVHGELSPADHHERLTADDAAALVKQVLPEEKWERFLDVGELDFSFSWREHARVRGNVFRQRGDVALALRMIPRAIPEP